MERVARFGTVVSVLVVALLAPTEVLAQDLEVAVEIAPALVEEPVDGRLLLLVGADQDEEPRFQIGWGIGSGQVFGIDVRGMRPGVPVVFPEDVFGWPTRRLGDLPAGEYHVQALLHRYDTFERADGHRVELPASWAAGQQWNREPGNLYSTPMKASVDPAAGGRLSIVLDREIPPIEPPEDTEYVRHVTVKSELLSEFWGRDYYLGAHVLVPHGFDEHPEARYPLMIFHGHYPADFGGFRTEPPDPDLECEYSERFDVECYNRVQQEEAYAFYQQWISDDFPRFLVIEIQHANPFYDDSYAVNSANLGPFGDAITYELVPYIEERFRGLGEGWARFLYGGSTGGWEALAAQVFYPTEYNGCFAACPDPIDFRHYMTVDIYEDDNAYYREGPFGRIARPGRRDYLGHVDMTIEDFNHMELALGTRTRSGNQFDIWEAVYSPVGPEGYPARLFDKLTGEIDPEVAAYWRDNYDLGHILRRDWSEIGPDLAGKIHIYCGDMDNYYLNNAVYLMEDFLESTTSPYYGGEVDYGDRAEHCWNGDQENPNHISRLRYNTMYLPRILERIEASAPEGADLTSWRH
ncbi:MAG: alpha/beta hydrolase-fold protein [Thermoanaerobaculia bacterium]|nr:alpha/beta hydrolase-fold protein [Thermoanaerobaculia bacterium]